MNGPDRTPAPPRAALAAAALAVLLLPALARPAAAQTPAAAGPTAAEVGQIRAYRQAHEHEILDEFVRLLRLPNDAARLQDIRANAGAIREMMERRGLAPRVLEPDDPAGRPSVYGEWRVPGATRTLVLYAHYDGQPATPERWTDGDPWRPVLRTDAIEAGGEAIPFPRPDERIDPEWRLYARSTSDNKVGVIAILRAIDALRAAGLQPTSSLKFFFEGEEEAGSPYLHQIAARHRDLLRADAWIVMDGPVHQSGAKQIVFGVRGNVRANLTVYGPGRPLHSGHYGNWAPNPGERLARLLASMKDDEGRVLVAGWYDDVEPLGPAERRANAEISAHDEEVRRQLAIGRPDGGGRSLAELISLPSLNVNGIGSAEIGAGARNVIPTEAHAVLDLRLAAGNDPDRQYRRLVDHVRAQGYTVIEHEPTDAERLAHSRLARVTTRAGSHPATRTPMDLPLARSVVDAVQATTDRPVVLFPTFGASLPLAAVAASLGSHVLLVPIANFDNNQHAEDENIRLQNVWDGIETAAAVMRMR
jgi:acetylornithine deacetylase/succinyl-diaminopimelate desuccinylase-like protein